jgi:hypothetical protein
MTERAALCDRAEAARAAVPMSDWTTSELRALVNLLEAIVEARRLVDEVGKPVDNVGNLVYLAGRR